MILLIDNYDSFVHNLARYVAELGCESKVVRNDRVNVDEIRACPPAAIIISPGPCTPKQAGVSIDIVRELGTSVPLLGVCLGHQAIAEAFGGRVVRADRPVHGQTSAVHHDGSPLFGGIPAPFRATRYHSLIAEESTLPAELRVTARTPDGIIMAIEHHSLPIFGTQFHPEAILTDYGHLLLANFLRLAGLRIPSIAESRTSELSVSLARDELIAPPSQPLHF